MVGAAATAAVLATNLLLVYFRRLFIEKPPGTSNGPEAFVLIENGLHHLKVQTRAKENPMEKPVFAVGERADKLCGKCDEERGHIVTAVTKRGQISRVSCPKCGTVSTFKLSSRTSPRLTVKIPSAYDRTFTYRAGQSIMHETFGVGEVTALIEPRKMDVLFQDRLRRLIHAQNQDTVNKAQDTTQTLMQAAPSVR